MSGLYRESKLKNGLTVATQEMIGAQTMALAISVDVGARYESEAESGLSHFLEHMAFKGTERRTALEIAEEMDALGASVNAYTSSEHTVYYARFLPEDLTKVVDVLSDILQHSTFTQEETDRERGVILQEIAMHRDAPEDLVFDYYHETLYPNQPLGRSIMGTEAKIEAYQPDDLRHYMAKHYCPARMIVSASGKVNHDALVALIEASFHYTESGTKITPEAMRYQGGEKRVKKDIEQMHFVLGFPGISFSDPDYYVAQVMTTILGGGMSSRLFQEVREKRGLVYNVYAFQSGYAEAGNFGVYAAASENKAAELVPVLADVLLGMADGGVSEAELARAKRQHTAGLKMVAESVSSVAEWIGRHKLNYGAFRDLDAMTANYEAVTAEAVQRSLKRVLGSGQPTVAVLGPQKGLASYDTIRKPFDVLKHAA